MIVHRFVDAAFLFDWIVARQGTAEPTRSRAGGSVRWEGLIKTASKRSVCSIAIDMEAVKPLTQPLQVRSAISCW